MKIIIGSVLVASKPTVAREFFVDENMPMKRFTNLVFLQYGIGNSHLHDYTLFTERDEPNPEDDYECSRFAATSHNKKITSKEIYSVLEDDDRKYEFEDDLKVKDVFPENWSGAILSYDYGDEWKIWIERVEGEIESYEEFGFIDGTNDGIVEDCGGIYALNDMRKTLNHSKGNHNKNSNKKG